MLLLFLYKLNVFFSFGNIVVHIEFVHKRALTGFDLLITYYIHTVQCDYLMLISIYSTLILYSKK